MSCTVITKANSQCKNKAKENGLCGIHSKKIVTTGDLAKDKTSIIINPTPAKGIDQTIGQVVVQEEAKELTEIKQLSIDPGKFGMELVYQNIQGTLALLKGKFLEEKMMIGAYESIKDQLIINPPINSPRGPAKQNRAIGFTSDVSKGYKYSNQMAPSIKLSPENRILLDYVNNMLGSDYNAILWNRYAPVDDYLSQHSDNEDSLGNTGVFSITIWLDAPINTSRAFRITNKPLNKDKANFKRENDITDLVFEDEKIKRFQGSEKVMDLMLGHLDTCLMYGLHQKYLEHGIPKSKKIKYTRVSATFRKHLI